MMGSEITLTLDSREVWSQPITSLLTDHFALDPYFELLAKNW